MKNKFLMILIMFVLLSMVGCSKEEIKSKPDEMKIRNICNLATLRVDYNNVAKTKKEGSGFLKGELKAWVEYKGFVKLGVDMSKVKMSLADKTVTITMPNAQVLDIDIVDESYNEDSWTFSQKEWWNTNKITTEDKTQAIKDAQTMMKETAAADTTLLMQAQNRAKLLIENYINQIGKLNKTDYSIIWLDVE